MGNLLQKTPPKHASYYGGTLLFDQILDAENQIYIGIGYGGRQVIRMGDYTHPYYVLTRFVEETHKNTLHYEFEDDIRLTLQKQKDNRIHLEVKHKDNYPLISTQMSPFVVKHFKSINLAGASEDFDKIYELFNREN